MKTTSTKQSRPIDPRRIEVIDRQSAAIMARLSGMKKIQLACQMGDDIRATIRRFLIKEHPGWTETQLREEMLRRAGHGKSI